MNTTSHSSLPKAVLIALHLPGQTLADVESSLAELTRLVTTLGYRVVGQIIQKQSSEKKASLLGDGKLIELARWTGGSGKVAPMVEVKKHKAALKRQAEEQAEAEGEEQAEENEIDESSNQDVPIEVEDPSSMPSSMPTEKADIAIADCDLSPSQLRNLESACGVQVLDRTGVIIEIFSRHARTKAARLQVEIARLTYVAPRLRETGGATERQGGGVGGRGAGETKLELDKRHIRDRIKELKQELAAVGHEHSVRRARREQEISVALVGYTNAGKSSLMRAMTGSEVLIADKLFATLDTTIRPLYPETRPKVLLSDTVGFIKKLPHDLVASFKSTLDEALNASLLLYVVDSADPSFRSQLEVTQSVLAEVGATDVPSLLVLNKRDRLKPEEAEALKLQYPEAVMISTRDKKDLQMLRDRILQHFESDMIDEDLFIPYTTQGVIGDIRARLRVLSEAYSAEGVTLKVRATPENIEFFRKKLD